MMPALKDDLGDDLRDGGLDGEAVAEADFAFGGVDVYVDFGGIDLDEEESHRGLAAGKGFAVTGAESLGEGDGFDGAAVEEGELEGAVGAREAGFAEVAAKGDGAAGDGRDLEEAVGEVGAGEAGDAAEEGVAGGKVEEEAIVAGEAESGLGMGEGLDADLLFDMAEFGVFGAEEFAAGGDVVEELADFDGGSGGVAGVGGFKEGAAFHDDPGASEGVGFAGGEGEFGDTGDAGKGFAAEAFGEDGGEVGAGAEFAGGVALEGHQGIFAGHAGAVVDDAEKGGAATAGEDGDLGGSGVEAVFHEFLYDGGGSFHDLASGDLTGQDIGEDLDFAHAAGKWAGKNRARQGKLAC